jgi:C4-dicarboxylate-specific signal transduction histidine kinase
MIADPADERARLDREIRIHKRLRELLLQFSRDVSGSLGLTAALDGLAPEIRDIFGARRVEIWLHDRRNRQILLTTATGGGAGASPVLVDDAEHYAATGMRLERPQADGSQIVAPLRGWRRALGTLVIDGSALPGEGEFVEYSRELARQLSVAIENVLLLEEILRQRRLLEDTFNSLVDLVAVMDKELRIVQTNDAFAARVSLERSDIVGRPLSELVGPDTLAYVEAADTWQGIVPAVQRRVDDPALDGTFLLTATPLTSQGGQTLGRVLVARDITRQTRLEIERAALRERLGQSEKLASLGQFVAGIAHEINNPLQGVMGHLELLIETADAARPLRRELKHIFQEAERAAKIVRNLLVFTGAHRIARRKTKVDGILTRALASRRPHLALARIRITRRQGAKLPPVMCDPSHLQQAFLNVLINAEHAVMDGDGERRIEITTSARKGGTKVLVTIRDHGPGIRADVLPRIFDPFFTTKEVGQGTGLGLAITYGIVSEHGGTITANNADGGGAVFQIELPVASVGGKVNAVSLP